MPVRSWPESPRNNYGVGNLIGRGSDCESERCGFEARPSPQHIEVIMYRDLFGKDIQVGDYFVYAGLADRSAVMRVGQVLELTHQKSDKWSFTKEPRPKIRAKSWNAFRAEGWGFTSDTPERSGRQQDVSLEYFDRLIVVSPEMVSDKIKRDLEGPVCGWNGKPKKG